jgi:nucleotide-binding universal stress UspA family protein
MYNVLIPVDTNEERALTQAEFVTSLPHAADAVRATVLFVFHGEIEELPDELRQFGSAQRVGAVRRAVEHLEAHGVEVEIREDSGDSAEDILRAAEDGDVDLIALGGRKRSPAAKAIFGSVSMSVLRNTDRPVVITGGGEE